LSAGSGNELTSRFYKRRLVATGSGDVPIKSFHGGRAFDPEAVTGMALAFEAVCGHLGLNSTSDDPATKLVAEKVIEFALNGIADPDLLQTMTMNELGGD
jgi:hypothetical protein